MHHVPRTIRQFPDILKQKGVERLMNDILARIGLLSIAVFILYIMKKINEYLYFKKIDHTCCNFDNDDAEY